LCEYGIEYLHDGALLGLGQAAELFELLLEFGRGLMRMVNGDASRTQNTGHTGIRILLQLVVCLAIRSTDSPGQHPWV
jgi:hypothetical protein